MGRNKRLIKNCHKLIEKIKKIKFYALKHNTSWAGPIHLKTDEDEEWFNKWNWIIYNKSKE